MKKLNFFDTPLTAKKTDFSNNNPLKTPDLGLNEIKIKAIEPLRNQLEHFILCIHNNTVPLTNIDESYIVTEWLQRISKRLNINY